jgi:hypothetical protein
MRLPDEITIDLGHEVIRLRASLRAAFRLERRHKGFDKIITAIAAGNLSVMADVIRESTDNGTILADLLDNGGPFSLKLALEHISGPLIAHVGALAGFDDRASEQPHPGAERIPFAEYHAKLFRIATGWLGWTPDAAWNASPAEIGEAYKGRLELLGAMFGSGSKTTDDGRPDEATRRELNRIGDLTNVSV